MAHAASLLEGDRRDGRDWILLRRPNGTTLFISTLRDRSDEDQFRFLDEGTDILLSIAEPFALIMDLRDLRKMPAKQRARYAASRARLRDVYQKHKVTTVYVLRDRLQRGFLSAIGWISNPSKTSGREFREDLDDAIVHCLEALDRHAR